MTSSESRRKARKTWKGLYCPNMPKDIFVHHKDENPFNNDLPNLTVMINGDHTRYHLKGKPKGMRKNTIENIVRKLESMLIIFNDR